MKYVLCSYVLFSSETACKHLIINKTEYTKCQSNINILHFEEKSHIKEILLPLYRYFRAVGWIDWWMDECKMDYQLHGHTDDKIIEIIEGHLIK